MEWESAVDSQRIIGDREPIVSFLIDSNGVVKAWITKPPSDWYWAKFGNEAPRGPFRSLAAAKLAAELMYDVQTKEEKQNAMEKSK